MEVKIICKSFFYKNYKNMLIIVLMLYVAFSCDKIEAPYLEKQNINNDTSTYVQKVLIEEFTGHRCGNCPRAHEKLYQLKQIYGNKLIGISIHSGFFAMPLPPNYPSDFRTSVGDEITSAFGISQYPSGMVNRKTYNGNIILSHDSWAEAVEAIIQQQPSLGIKIQNSYQSSQNTVTTSVEVKILQTINVPVKMVVYAIEDSIISAQTDYEQNPTLIPNYVHMHVLRTSFNGTWGNDIPVQIKTVGDTIKRTFTISWNNNWNETQSSVVVVLYNSANNEIIQVEKKRII